MHRGTTTTSIVECLQFYVAGLHCCTRGQLVVTGSGTTCDLVTVFQKQKRHQPIIASRKHVCVARGICGVDFQVDKAFGFGGSKLHLSKEKKRKSSPVGVFQRPQTEAANNPRLS